MGLHDLATSPFKLQTGDSVDSLSLFIRHAKETFVLLRIVHRILLEMLEDPEKPLCNLLPFRAHNDQIRLLGGVA